ncbi:hypothetical protein BOTBODRAFT_60621 [Botryobasidium botryosum FD-172 SS1]|uniref:Uncharacterized protein n=1 Tax=Botryobasidium botryosum (strain FD-172 SS1) TaxID=930990 RepID=A0A067LVY0_BOTB1|nr:hypothetical protein BOTBODRAFT_60621 [Botryobasidium botryosum FD-172 SS1]
MPFTNGFLCVDITQLLAPNLLHQVIKGTFKDHLMDWIWQYLKIEHSKTRAKWIMDDIDRWQYSKALMKVILPALVGHLPPEIIHCVRSFLDLCYLLRRDSHTEDMLNQINVTLKEFQQHCEFFRASSVHLNGFSLPHQHLLVHYRDLIEEFGSPNRLCTSIMENRHITAMLPTNQRLDKLATARVDFADRGMLQGTTFSAAINALLSNDTDNTHDDGDNVDLRLGELSMPDGPEDDDSGPCQSRAEPKYPQYAEPLGTHIGFPNLLGCIRQFLHQQLRPNNSRPLSELSLDDCPGFYGQIQVFHSAIAMICAPCDQSGISGMMCERVWAVPLWQGGPPHYDCVFVKNSSRLPGMRGMHTARVRLFFSFTHNSIQYPCVLVEWFVVIGNSPDPDTGMWQVRPKYNSGDDCAISVIPLDSIIRNAHLMPLFGPHFLPKSFHFHHSLDLFKAFYVNKYVDHHANELAF